MVLHPLPLAAFLRKRWIALPFTAATILIIGFLWNHIPAEMAPLEDRSQISINTRGAEGVTYEYTRDYTEDINQLVDSIVPDAEAVTARVSSGSGNVRITLKDMQDRDYTQMEVAEKLSKAVQKKTMARSFVQQSSSFGGRRGGMPVQYVLQATNIEKLQEVLPKFMAVKELTADEENGGYSVDVPVIVGLNDANYEKSLNDSLMQLMQF